MNKKITLLFAFLLLALMSGYSQKNVTKQNHYNLAIAAIKANNLSKLDAQLKHIKNIDSLIRKDESTSYTLLGFACLYKNKAAIEKLIAQKANIDYAYSDDIHIRCTLYGD